MYLDSDAYLDSVDRDHDDHRFAPAYGVKVDGGWLTREGFAELVDHLARGRQWAADCGTEFRADGYYAKQRWTYVGAVTVTPAKGWAYSFATAEQASAFAEAAGFTFRYVVVAL